jgi:hypothetical protein
VPVCGSHSSPPLQPPSTHAFGPLLLEKSQSRRPCARRQVVPAGKERRGVRTQMRPACQLFGMSNVTDWYAPCSQPVECDGTAVPTFRSVNICNQSQLGRLVGKKERLGRTAGQMVNGQPL